MLLRSNCDCIPSVQYKFYAHTLNGSRISRRVTSLLSVLLIQLAAGPSLSSISLTGLWRLSPWHIVARGQGLPSGVHVYSTRGLEVSWAIFKWLTVGDICAAASLASPHISLRFYHLDVTTPSAETLQCAVCAIPRLLHLIGWRSGWSAMGHLI